jgi:hypothetical protein
MGVGVAAPRRTVSMILRDRLGDDCLLNLANKSSKSSSFWVLQDVSRCRWVSDPLAIGQTHLLNVIKISINIYKSKDMTHDLTLVPHYL